MIRVLLDANVLLDYLLDRQPFTIDAEAVWNACRDGRCQAWVSGITPVNIFYIARKRIGADSARLLVVDILKTCFVSPVDLGVLEEALLIE